MVYTIAKLHRVLLTATVAFLTSMGLLTSCGESSIQEDSDRPQNVRENEGDQDDEPNAPRQNGDNDDDDDDDDNDDDNDNNR